MVAGTPRSLASSSSPQTPPGNTHNNIVGNMSGVIGGTTNSSNNSIRHTNKIIQVGRGAPQAGGSRTKSTGTAETRTTARITPPRHRPPLGSSTNGNHHNNPLQQQQQQNNSNTTSPTLALSEGETTTTPTTGSPPPLAVSSGTCSNNNNMTPPALPRHKQQQQQQLLPPQQQQHQLLQQQQQQQQPTLRATIDGNNNNKHLLDTVEQEQALFEQRLCEDSFGIAVRKINQYGKSSLRYVKCIEVDAHVLEQQRQQESSHHSNRSVGSLGSWGGRRNSFGHYKRQQQQQLSPLSSPKPEQPKLVKALAWGKKKDVQIALASFVSVRKGKTTERTRRNAAHSSRVLSLLTDDPSHPSLDIEAPTKLDRDKFARAFARFLQVPLEGSTADCDSVNSAEAAAVGMSSDLHSSGKTATSRESDGERLSASLSAPGDVDGGIIKHNNNNNTNSRPQHARTSPQHNNSSSNGHSNNNNKFPPPIPPSASPRGAGDNNSRSSHHHSQPQHPHKPDSFHSSQPSSTKQSSSSKGVGGMVSLVPVVPVTSPPPNNGDDADGNDNDNDHGSAVSSLTGHGYDQELVEELHHALNDLRAELEESRAEAARAVKVAEQAIQSAERNNSQDWQNTVTHKAAEAAALAQKRSAQAMAKQRLAEERLEAEIRTATFWRKQAEFAEEEAGKLQTRAAAAEVQRAAMEEQLESERRLASSLVGSMKQRFVSSENQQQLELETARERNRALELALSSTRSDLESSKLSEESSLQQQHSSANDGARGGRRKLGFGRKKKPGSESKPILSRSNTTSSAGEPALATTPHAVAEGVSPEQLQKLYTESLLMRQKFEALRRTTADELQKLPMESKQWAEQVVQAFESSQTEVSRLRNRMAAESASRRKLLHEVQDLRGCVRVYCRPTPPPANGKSLVSLPSQDTIMLHREMVTTAAAVDGQDNNDAISSGPMSFEFDRVFGLNSQQQDVYSEVEEVCLGVLDGYNICVLGYGQTGKGKTRTLLGDPVVSDDRKVKLGEYGVQLRAVEQLFSIANRRSDRYNDTFTLTIVEVYNERLCDLLAGTQTGEHHGQALAADSKSKRKKSGDGDETSSRSPKLEIRTDVHGNTVVQGLLSVAVESFESFLSIWEECLEERLHRLAELEVDPNEYEAASHVIATVKVVSANIATGMGTVGKLEFVDLAGADLMPKPAGSPSKTTEDNFFASVNNDSELCFANRSLDTLAEVVAARIQFARAVPYRNSTLTHLLRDSLEADTKVLLIACVSSDPENAQETIATLRFASRIRRVHIGKATKHMLSTP